jgi:hypothetical protein
MKDYLGLLLDFQALPRIRQGRTFMEVAGYPHYENVCSNILAFYFDPTAEHGMGDMVLSAFFKMVKERAKGSFSEPDIPGLVTITREHPAEELKRIDLVIHSEAFTVGIENKIYHWEANDLESYARVIDGMGSGRTVVKAILCLRADPRAAAPLGGFIRYTYLELWNHVQSLLGHYLSFASPQWVIYLNEFMRTTTRLAGETPDEIEVTDFFIKNHALIEQLVSDRQQLLNRLATRMKSIEAQVKDAPEFAKYRKGRGLCGPNVLASHFDILGRTIGMDLAVNMSGWQLQLWDNGAAPHAILRQLADAAPMQNRFHQITLNGGFTILQRWDLHVEEMQLLQAITTGYSALIAAADSIMSDPA